MALNIPNRFHYGTRQVTQVQYGGFIYAAGKLSTATSYGTTIVGNSRFSF